MRAAKVQASLRIRAVSPEPPLLAHISSESRGTFRQKARSLAPLNGWACAVKICNYGMHEDTDSLDGAQLLHNRTQFYEIQPCRSNVMMLSFRTDRSRGAVWPGSTLPFRLHLLDSVEPHCSNFRIITAIFWGIQIIRNFTGQKSLLNRLASRLCRSIYKSLLVPSIYPQKVLY